jgi:4-hydroxy-tetrahydrodipicolinate synthase
VVTQFEAGRHAEYAVCTSDTADGTRSVPATIGITMLQGVFPVLPTIFDDDGQVDASAQMRVVQFALSAHADGVVFPGVASEYNYLTAEERSRLLRVVVDEVDGRIPIVGGASSTNSAEAVALGTAARSLGIRHLMIMAPAGLGDDVEAHKQFFLDIANKLPDIEIVLQNAPSPIGAGLSPKSILEIASAVRSITYIKEETLPSGPRITALSKGKPESVAGIFGGGGARYIVDELNRGAVGAMPAVEITDLHAALFRAHQAGDTTVTRRLYRLSLPLLVSQAIYRMRLTKHVLAKRGISQGVLVRAPLPVLDRQAMVDIDRMLDDLQTDSHDLFQWIQPPNHEPK